MKEWNLKVTSNVQEIIKKLNSTLGSVDGFDLNVDDAKKNSATFKLRKRGLYAFQTIFLNRIVVNGTVYKASAENESDVKISFTQDFLAKLILLGYIISGLALSLIAIISGIESNIYMLLAGAFVLILGVAFWFDVKRRFEKNIQKYKTLISEILD